MLALSRFEEEVVLTHVLLHIREACFHADPQWKVAPAVVLRQQTAANDTD